MHIASPSPITNLPDYLPADTIAPIIMQRAASFLPPIFRNFVPKTGKKVAIIGGGSAGLFCAERLRHLFDVVVIDPKGYYEYSPGMCRALLQPFAAHGRITFDYQTVLEDSYGIEFVQGFVKDVPTARSLLIKCYVFSGLYEF